MAEDDQVAALEPPDTPVTQPSMEPATPAQPVQDTTSERPTSALDDPGERAARRLARGQIHRDPTPIVSSDEQFAAVGEGAEYIDPEGARRKKPYKVTDDVDFDRVPEGAHYEDPEGNIRQKPKSDPVSYSAQTLYGMSTNEKERRKALERSYPGKVKQDSAGQLYVDDNGKIRRPKGFFEAPGAGASSMAGPVAGSVIGEIAGMTAGSIVPFAGTAAGAVTGAAMGAAAGQTFNDAILTLTGVYDRSIGEQAFETGAAAVLGGAGTAAGRAISAIPKASWDTAKSAAPKAVRGMLGVDEEGLQTAVGMREKGAELVPPSMWAKGAPYVANIAEVFDPAFRLQKPIREAGINYYDKMTRGVANKLGIKLDEELVSKPSAAVSSREAGELLLQQRTAHLQQADANLEAKLAEHQARGPVSLEGVNSAAAEARTAAQQVINSGFDEIQTSVRTAAQLAEAGHNSGDLWAAVGNRMRAVHAGITERGRVMYNAADHLAGPHLPNAEGIPDLATDFLRELPPQFRSSYPHVVQDLERLAGVPKVDPHGNPIPGEWAVEPHQPTFGELRRIRSLLRGEANWSTLSGDTRNGTFKFFAHRVDEALTDVAAVPELQAAVTQLNAADEFWRDNIRVFNAQQVRAVMRGIEAGEPADAKQLFNVLMREGHTDLTNRLMDMIGPALAGGVRAADVQEMLAASKTLIPGQLDGMRFVREVLDRERRGMLESIHGPQVARQLTEQAQRISALEGKLDIPARHGDTALDIMSRARATAELKREAARRDPLKVFEGEMKRIKADHAKEMATTRRNDPLGIIYKPTVGASEAADHILASEDLLLAAADRFKRTSPEFEALRQVYVKRLFSGTSNISTRIKEISPEVQSLMFPGTSLQDLQLLAKEMEHFANSKGGATVDTAKSMAAQAKVNHPWGSIPGGKMVGKFIPGVDAAGRYMLGKYYQKITELTNNLTLMKWLAKGLRGDEAAKARSREVLEHIMKRGGAGGASIGGAVKSFPGQPGMSGDIEEEGGAQPQKFVSDDDMEGVPPPARPGRVPVNAKAFSDAMESHAPSENVEDRRGEATPQATIDDDFHAMKSRDAIGDMLRIAVHPNDRSKEKSKKKKGEARGK